MTEKNDPPKQAKPPRDYVKHPLGESPTQKEITAFLHALRRDFNTINNNALFFEKYKQYFNCYAYASGGIGSPYVMSGYDRPGMTYAVPGALAGEPMRLITRTEIDRAVVADGYERVVTPTVKDPKEKQRLNEAAARQERKGYTLVAAFIDDHGDTQLPHFAVRNQSMKWSQKFGSGSIDHTDYDGRTPIRPPHLGQNYFQKSDTPEHNLDFVGYYWRKEEGINVIGGIVPQVGILDPKTNHYREDVWLSSNGTLRIDKEVTSWKLKKEANGDVSLDLKHGKEHTQVRLPKSVLFSLEGVTYIMLQDKSGSAHELHLQKDGHVKDKEVESKAIKRPSPFR